MIGIAKNNFSVHRASCGRVQGKEICKITLDGGSLQVDITNLGGSISGLFAPDRDGIRKNVVAGFAEITAYQNNPHYLGCILGRYANRIADGRFTLDHQDVYLSVNDGVNHLHGGFAGFNRKVWQISSLISDTNKAQVELEYFSCNGEEGYPGNLSVTVKYILSANKFSIEYYAETDKATPVNLSNHSYFNLSGFETQVIKDHLLYINAESYTEKNSNNIPTGRIVPVSGTPLDFTSPKKIGADIDKFPLDKGYDHNFILNKNEPRDISFAAQLKDLPSGRVLNVYTDQPALQLYTANLWDGALKGLHGAYQQHAAVALETQSFPDSPNHPCFPGTILRPGNRYFSTTIYEFVTE